MFYVHTVCFECASETKNESISAHRLLATYGMTKDANSVSRPGLKISH